MGIWVLDRSNQLFIRKFLNGNKNGNKIFKGPFCTHHSVCLNIGFWYGSFAWKWYVFNMAYCKYNRPWFSILVVLTKKPYSSFLKKVFIFQKISFKFEALKTFKITTDCLIKTSWSHKRRAILKISIIVFYTSLCSFC